VHPVCLFELLVATHTRAPGNPASTVLRELAEREGLSLIACGLTDEVRYHGTMGGPEETLDAVCTECGLEVAVWRNLLLARPNCGGSVRERIEGSLGVHDRRLLLRPPDAGEEWEPGWHEVVVGAARAMLVGDTSEEAEQLRSAAILWITARDLQEVFRWEEAIESGRAFVRVAVNETPLETAVPLDGNDSRRFLVAKVARARPDDPTPCLQAVYPGDDFSVFARTFVETKPLVTEAEYEARYLASYREHHSLRFSDNGTVISLDQTGTGREVLEALADKATRPLAWAADDASPVTICLDHARLEDAVLGLCAVCGVFLTDQGAVVEPSLAIEHILTALPLRLWASVMSCRAELGVAAQHARRRFWGTLPETELHRLAAAGARLGTLEGEERQAADALLWVRPAELLQAAVWSLPRRGQPLPISLYEERKGLVPDYIVATRGRAERLGSGVYAELRRMVADGEPLEWAVGQP